jgi:hypothetical protein
VVALKLGSTGYRFFRYYTRRPDFVRAGPPQLLLRMLGPLVVLSTVGLLATGIALIWVGPGGGVMLNLHKASFAVWLVALGAHVLAHIGRLLHVLARPPHRPDDAAARRRLASAVRRRRGRDRHRHDSGGRRPHARHALAALGTRRALTRA